MSLKKHIGAMVASWITAMLLAALRSLVTRALNKHAAKTSARRADVPPYRQNATAATQSSRQTVQPPPFRKWTVTDTIYQGMSRSELLSAYGEPSQKAASAAREVWTYAPRRLNDNRQPGMTVTLQGGVVTDWTEDAAA